MYNGYIKLKDLIFRCLSVVFGRFLKVGQVREKITKFFNIKKIRSINN